MSEHQKISAIAASDDIHSVYLINAASLQKSKNGPYWRLELKDASGTLEAKIWSPLSQSFSVLMPGQMAEVSGRVSLFRDQPQLTVDAMRVLSEEESAALPLEEYLPSSERPSADMLADIEALCEAVFTHKPWKKFVRSVLNDKRIRSRLLVAPAAKSMHHAYAGGLLEHLLSVAGLCMHMADHYSDLDRQALLAGALLHDIGKIDEMGGVLTTEYTDEGRLLGHIAQGLIMLEPFLQKSGLEPELAAHFKHLVASHHGEREFGAVSLPATSEAFALHFADNMDAKLNQCRSVPLPENEGEMAWGPWQSLMGRTLCRPVRTPSPAATVVGESQRKSRAEKKNDRMDERQCSLL